MTDENPRELTWPEEQLIKASVTVAVGDAVMALLSTWEDLEFPNRDQRDIALEYFCKLAVGEALFEDQENLWVPADTGIMIRVGDTVRVKKNAFDGKPGEIHNGKVGKVVAKRNGDIIVRYEGSPTIMDTNHLPPMALEILAIKL